MMQALGKETLVIKTVGTAVPSDFIRTEYVEFGDTSVDFERRAGKFVETVLSLAEYFESVADQIDRNPLLAIDYLRRAFLISPHERLRQKRRKIAKKAGFKGRANNSVEMLWSDF